MLKSMEFKSSKSVKLMYMYNADALIQHLVFAKARELYKIVEGWQE